MFIFENDLLCQSVNRLSHVILPSMAVERLHCGCPNKQAAKGAGAWLLFSHVDPVAFGIILICLTEF